MDKRHNENHWQGNYWGSHGAIWRSWKIFFLGDENGKGRKNPFSLLSTHYSALKVPHGVARKIVAIPGLTWAFFWTFVVAKWIFRNVPLENMTGDQCDVLATVLRRLGYLNDAVFVGKAGLKKCDEHNGAHTRALLCINLARAYAGIYQYQAASISPSPHITVASAEYYKEAEALAIKGFDPPQQLARVFRGLAAFALELQNKMCAEYFLERAEEIARSCSATDQVDKIMTERRSLLASK